MTVRLRPMRLGDLPAVLELEEELFAPDTWTAAMYQEELARADTRTYLVAEDGAGDGIVGYGGLIAYDDEAHVATLGVATARQGEGIGGQLLDALLDEADRHSPVVILEVRADNEVAQGLYRHRGFTVIGRRRGYYQPSGTDAVVMRRERLRPNRDSTNQARANQGVANQGVANQGVANQGVANQGDDRGR